MSVVERATRWYDTLPSDRERAAVLAAILGAGALAAGYAGGSVYAGQPLSEQTWALPVVAAAVLAALVLYEP